MVTEEECFLDDDAWRNLSVESSGSPFIPESSEHFQDGLNHFARVPGLLKQARRISEGRSPDLFDFLSEAASLRTILITWFDKLKLASGRVKKVIEVPLNGKKMFAARLVYKDMMTASFAVTYCAYMIRLNSAIDNLQEVALYSEDNAQLAFCICMSTEYCSHGGFCGAQTLCAALPVASTVLPAEYSGWIDKWIKKVGDIETSLKLETQLLEQS
jgi:hypothetical protein